MKQRFIIHIRGSVQGIGYRVYAKQEADRLALMGFVRNEPDGSVLVDAEGEEESLTLFMALCQYGLPSALVESLEMHELPLEGYTSFVIARKWLRNPSDEMDQSKCE